MSLILCLVCMQEIELNTPTGSVLKFAQAYGFRNIQTLVRKIKRGNSQYDYVEVMACPSGCLNGGGQPKHLKEQSPQDLLKDVEKSYDHEVCTVNQDTPQYYGITIYVGSATTLTYGNAKALHPSHYGFMICKIHWLNIMFAFLCCLSQVASLK